MSTWIGDVEFALRYLGKPIVGEIEEFHYSNHAIAQVFIREPLPDLRTGCREMICSYEDRSLEAYETAKDVCKLIAALMPGEWVMVDTGDFIQTTLPADQRDPDGDQWKMETYDPHNHIYLIHVDVFERKREELDRIEKAWREEKQALANSKVPEHVKLGDRRVPFGIDGNF